MRIYISILIVLTLLGVVAAAIAAVVEIETILVSGPACSLVGLLIAAPSYRRNLQLSFLYGLSFFTMSVLCFVTIFGLEWSPGEAHIPIGSAIVLYAVLLIPFGIFALLELRRAGQTKRGIGLQYGIAQLLGLMFFTAVVVAFFRSGKTPAMAIAVLIAYGVVAGYVVYRFYAGRRKLAAVPMKEGCNRDISQPRSYL